MPARPGDWIDFETLCGRVPLKKPRTLRRMIAARQISFRQNGKGGRLEFNWDKVSAELALLETPGINSPLIARTPEAAGEIDPVRFARVERTIEAIAKHLGIQPEELFAGEQRRSA